MLPPLRHRVLIVIAVGLGGVCWMLAEPMLTAADTSTGLSLTDPRVGVPLGVLVLAATGLPAILLGLAGGAVGNPLATPFIVGTALLMLAADGGPIDGYLLRSDQPGGFVALAFESLGWAVATAGLLLATGWLHERVLGGKADDAGQDAGGARPAWRRVVGWFTPRDPAAAAARRREPGWLAMDGRMAVAGLATAALGGLVGHLLIRSADSGQVIGGLLLGYAVSAMVVRTAFPGVNPLGILLAPCVTGIAAYAYGAMTFDSGLGTQSVWFKGGLFGLLRVLPIYFASAGLAGAAIGVGLAQSVEVARKHQTDEPVTA